MTLENELISVISGDRNPAKICERSKEFEPQDDRDESLRHENRLNEIRAMSRLLDLDQGSKLQDLLSYAAMFATLNLRALAVATWPRYS